MSDMNYNGQPPGDDNPIENEIPEEDATSADEEVPAENGTTDEDIIQPEKTTAEVSKKSFFQRLGAVRIIILVVLVAVLAVSVYKIVDDELQDRAGQELYKGLEHVYLVTPPPEESPLVTPTPVPLPPIPSDDPLVIIDEPPEESSPPEERDPIIVVENYAPDIWPDVDWNGLYERNSDTAAWLLCPGTNINYPVVYSNDNAEYLTTMFDGNSSKVGTLFVDMRNSKGFTDRNTVIHGHNMRNHSMFWTLTQYKSQRFYNAHPTMRLITPEGKFEIQLFAGIVADSVAGADFWKVRFSSDEDFAEWISYLYELSTFDSYVEVTTEDRMITMSTCSYEYSTARYIVVGKLVPVG